MSYVIICSEYPEQVLANYFKINIIKCRHHIFPAGLGANHAVIGKFNLHSPLVVSLCCSRWRKTVLPRWFYCCCCRTFLCPPSPPTVYTIIEAVYFGRSGHRWLKRNILFQLMIYISMLCDSFGRVVGISYLLHVVLLATSESHSYNL